MLEKVISWVKEVGKLQLQRLETNLNISTKSGEFDLVTEVDQLSEEILIEHILNEFPNHSILAEENGSLKHHSKFQWIIDPLDGTTNYIHGFPIFSISVALKYCDELIMGVIYVPRLDELYVALKGRGAYLNYQRIEVSTSTSLESSLLSTGFPYNRGINSNNNLNFFNQLVPKIRGIRRTGSAAYDLCNVATGRFDGYWELSLNSWDIAAGRLLVEEAKGKVISLKVGEDSLLVAGNEMICDLLLTEFEADLLKT